MDPIALLIDEHLLIVNVLQGLSRFVETLTENTAPEAVEGQRAELMRFIEFIQQFADAHHHAKEEKILFDEMAKAGFPTEMGPIAVMLYEHDQGRALVETMIENGQAKVWGDAERKAIRETAEGFVELLERHIEKENGILYPMAQSRLSSGAMQSVSDRVARFEADETNLQASKRLRALGQELAGAMLHKA